MKGFIIIGSESNLGKTFVRVHPNHNLLLKRKQCDITKYKSILDVLSKSNYEYVLNCAAITDLHFCELYPQKCLTTNSIGAKNVEKACLILDKKLIQISSDYARNPINIYGKSKKNMEEILNKNKTLILRTSFYYSNYELFINLRKGKAVEGFLNLYFNPVSSYFLAKHIIKNRDKYGLINVFSKRKISKFNFLKMYCKIYKIDEELVKPKIYTNGQTTLRRPLDSFIKPDVEVDLEKDMKLFKKYSDL